MASATRILLLTAAVGAAACPDFPVVESTESPPGTTSGTAGSGLITTPTTSGQPPTVTTVDFPLTVGPDPTTAGPDLPGFDEPPWIAELVVEPAVAVEIGPSIVTYKASPDAVEADLLDDGALVATRPAGEAFVFPVTSAPHNNPGSMLRVVVRDAAQQVAYAEKYQPSEVKAPGTPVWTSIDADDGGSDGGGSVALQDDFVVSAGFKLGGDQARMTLRRYDHAGGWLASEDGWSRDHPAWTKSPVLAASNITGSAVAIDGGGSIIAVGNLTDGVDTRVYLARFTPDGDFDWELLGNPGTEGRGVDVTADGTIYVAGAIRTDQNPDRWDLAVWVHGADKVAHGSDVYADPGDELNQRSERGRAVAVLASGRIAVAGTREVQVPGWDEPLTRGVLLLYEGKGKRVGEWSSPGEVRPVDAVLAAVATVDGVALGGHAIDPADPQKRPQILLRWLREDLSETRAPHLEATLGGASCTALGYTIERKLIVGANVQEGDQSDNVWIFAVGGPADPPITYVKYNGPAAAADRIFGLDCRYMCAWSGYQGTALGGQWMTALLRG